MLRPQPDVKQFAQGGMDFDSSFEYVEPNDSLENYNVANTGEIERESGTVTNITSTRLLPITNHTGINKGIGAAGFELTRTGISFIYNSQQFHAIRQVNYDTDEVINVFVNLTDSGSVNILPLDPKYYITDLKQVNDIFYAWTDGNNQPCLINFERILAGGFGVLTQNDFLIIKAQCLIPMIAVYGDDTGQAVNLIQQKLFQFRGQYVYIDDFYSVWCSISKRPVPISEATPAVGTDVTVNNNIVVSINIGTNRVKTVNVSARYSNYDWFTIKSASREYILALPTAINIPQEIYEAYDPGTNLYSIAFYNDGLYVNIDPIDTDQDYDHVPLKCESLENINGDLLALMGLTEGYPRPMVDVTLSVVSYDPGLNVIQPVGGLSVASTLQYRIEGTHKRNVTITYSGTAHTGDVLDVKLQDIRDYSIVQDYPYTVPITQDGNTQAALLSLAATIPGASFNAGDTSIVIQTQSYFQLQSATVIPFNAATAAVKSIHALKSNSSYQLALLHFDKWGRYFPMVTGTDYVLQTLSYAQSQGLTPQINWRINSAPPVDAASAQWAITLNNTHENWLFVDSTVDNSASTADYLIFNINPLRDFNLRNSSSILSYDYTPGDRCTMHFYYSSGTTPVWFNSPAIDVEVVGFTVDITNNNWLLKIRKPSSLTVSDIVGKNTMIEIYTPRLRTNIIGGASVPAEQLFFEIGEQIGITNGAYDTTSGQISDGDNYFKTRQMEGAVDPALLYDFLVECPDFSDFYQSNYYSLGRPRVYSDEPGTIQRKASIRYSDIFRRGSTVNGLNRFFGERIYGDGDGESSSNYGWIRKGRQRNNVLVIVQEQKVGYIDVFQTLVLDQAGSEQYALSDRIFNKIRYNTSGNIGMGNAKESYAEYSNDLYWVDPFRSEPVRAGLDGVESIAKKMSKYFKRVYQTAFHAGKKVIGNYDIFNGEYINSIENDGDIVSQIPFTTDNWQFDNEFDVIAGMISLTAQGTKGVTTYNSSTGIATYTGNAGQTGADHFTFSFTIAGHVHTVGSCGVITAGSDAVNSFAFTALTGKEVTTVYESINTALVFGNTIAAAISISGASGQYSINGGAYTSSPGTVISGDVVRVRQTSSGSLNTTTTTTLTIDGQSAAFLVTTKTVNSFAINLRTSTSAGTVCASEYITLYLTSPLTDIAPGVTVYDNANLTIPHTGDSYIVDLSGDIFNLNSATGVVGSATGGDCGVPPSTFRFDQIYNFIGDESYLLEVSFIGGDVYTFTQPQLSNIPISPAIPAGTYNIEISSQGLIGSITLNGSGVSSPAGLCQNGSSGSGGEIYDFVSVTIPAAIDFAIILNSTPC